MVNKYKKITIFFILTLNVCIITKAYAQDELKESLKSTDNNAPLLINSDNLDLDTTSRIFTYSGNVKLTKGDMKINSDKLIGKYDSKNQIELVTCDDNVVITKGNNLKANSEHAVYRVKQSTIELTEAPELLKDGSLLSADKITIFVDQDKSKAEGNVRVKVIQQEQQ